MLFFRRAYPGQHLQEMLTDLRRIIIIGGTDETESVGHQDVALRLLLLVFLPFFIFLVCTGKTGYWLRSCSPYSARSGTAGSLWPG